MADMESTEEQVSLGDKETSPNQVTLVSFDNPAYEKASEEHFDLTNDAKIEIPSNDVDKILEKTKAKLEKEQEEDPWTVAMPELLNHVNWQDLTTAEKFHRFFVDWLILGIVKLSLLLGLLYLFICSLDVMSSAFRLLGGKAAGQAFAENELLANPVCGLMIGVLVTVLVQSSSTSTSIVVSMVAAEVLYVRQAIPIVMGANIGTSVTNTIVSIGQAQDKNEFRRAFGGATVHDMFNWLCVLILLPLEVASGYLYRLSDVIVRSLNLSPNEDVDIELLKVITKPFTTLVVQIDKNVITDIAIGSNDTSGQILISCAPGEWKSKCNHIFGKSDLSDAAVGAILLVISLVCLCVCLILIVKLLHWTLKGRLAIIVRKTVDAKLPGKLSFLTGYLAILMGALLTFILQSSSIFTSALTPLVGIGIISLKRMYPLTLGSNIGTTATGLLAALASSSGKFAAALQIAFCHLFFNISGILIWYPIPILRRVPMKLAMGLGNTTAKYRWFAAFYLIAMFFIFPAIVFGLSLASTWCLLGVGVPFLLLVAFVIIVNILQSNKPHWLPQRLRTWDFLPKPLRSLRPYDRLIFKSTAICGRYCKRCNDDANDTKLVANEQGLKATTLVKIK
ncbi:sodium-dependent phosphate transport protein 2A-like [Amphiura filiformis]|uniref:sodium-dependent phosphate transport protein 2A-like n=1 Tax=Amphiura filiformis TaxID=82378 RepID=UPI003B20E874